MTRIKLTVESGDTFEVRAFTVHERMDHPFRVELRVVSTNPDVDPDALLGSSASFELSDSFGSRLWTGVCLGLDQLRVEPGGLSAYAVQLGPRLEMLGLRKNYRIFQYESELDIARRMLEEWRVPFRVQVDPGAHRKRKFRVQYGETDLAFVSRMLEDAGISSYFVDVDGETTLVLDDAPHAADPSIPPLRFHDRPGVTDAGFATSVHHKQRVRPGRATVGDLDYRKPSDRQPRLSRAGGRPMEARLEVFDYEPGAFLFVGDGSATPSAADDRGSTRTDETTGARRVEERLRALRRDERVLSFESDVLALAPGTVLQIDGHPDASVGSADRWLAVDTVLEGEHDGDWRVHVEALPCSHPVRPDRRTPRPRVAGLESATVVGPLGEEIHTDEYARVRVHFHWDRESGRDERSSCWVPTSQPWAGAGFGSVNLPRIGQEVLVEFLGGDPDRPVVIVRYYTETMPVPQALPRYKNVTGILSESTPRLVMGASDPTPAEGPVASRGVPMSAEELDELLTGDRPFRATSPTGQAHGWHGDALLFDDTAGAELAYLQAERDFNVLAKNSWTTVVGNLRACMVGVDDRLDVGNKQRIYVARDQILELGGDQTVDVGEWRYEQIMEELGQSVGEGIDIGTTGDIAYEARGSIVIESEESITLKVGETFLVLTPEEVILQSSRTDLNPAQGEEPDADAERLEADAAEIVRRFAAIRPKPSGLLSGRQQRIWEAEVDRIIAANGITDPVAAQRVRNMALGPG